MKTVKFEVEIYYEVPICECGGIFTERFDSRPYLTDPMQADFKCNKCGKVKRFFENDWPSIKKEINFDRQID
jgi:hypothetical protein